MIVRQALRADVESLEEIASGMALNVKKPAKLVAKVRWQKLQLALNRKWVFGV